jgi:hypothetical protein
MERTNGYPNNYWGWGGEDDEFRRRLEEADIKILRPRKGTIVDTENLLISELGQGERAGAKGSTFKCFVKDERNFEHECNWQQNGLRNLEYQELKREHGPAVGQAPEYQQRVNGTLSDTDKGRVMKITVELFGVKCPAPQVKLSSSKSRGMYTVEWDNTGRGMQGGQWRMPPPRIKCFLADSPDVPEPQWWKCKKGPTDKRELPDLLNEQSCKWM